MIPDIYLFNPTCELAVANGDANYMPPQRLLQFERDLTVLPWFFARADDIVLVHKLPPASFLELWHKAGKVVPNFLLEEKALGDKNFIQQPKGFLHPWGWSPAMHRRLEAIKVSCSNEFKDSPVAVWSENTRNIYSRKTARDILRQVLEYGGNSKWLLPFDKCPAICTSIDEIVSYQERWERLVVKSPWSASGRGIQMLRTNEFNQTNRQVITGFLKQQGYVMVEPWLNKIADLSLHFYTPGNGEVTYHGQASFMTDLAGRYQGNFIRELPDHLSNEEREFVQHHLPRVARWLQTSLSAHSLSRNYVGWIGVDLILYQDKAGELRLHPCLEINFRYNMGALTLQLREFLATGTSGQWQIAYGQAGEIAAQVKRLMDEFPVRYDNGKITEGVIPLAPVCDNALFGAWMKVEPS